MKALQIFSDEYLEQCKKMRPEQIIGFLENFRVLHSAASVPDDKSVLISIKIPQSLLMQFRTKSELHGQKYQTQIKKLMKEWLR